MASLRQRQLEAFKVRLQAIAKTDGFETDAGSAVYMNEVPAMGPDDPDALIAMVVGDEQPKHQAYGLSMTLPIEVQAIVKTTLDEPWVAAEQMLSDIKKAVELENRTLGRLLLHPLERGITRILPRETGSSFVGVGITYSMERTEAWGGS